ncbi:4'-phosphopantetheinyl transferase superfamily protein [Streptomyces sp. NPDC046197]|uniref:4'-phosphopantetheinyl transferase family protein n=1 Tax=Streptomyces sp. NPDC046197 TaxID=3154337 RepID=UPI0033C267E9
MSWRPVHSPNAVTVVLGPACGDPRQAARRMLVRMAAELGPPLPEGAVPHVVRDDRGRPYLSLASGPHQPGSAGGDPWCRVSISHCAGVVAVALAAAEVGVDVELSRPLPVVNLARRWFDPAEAAWLASRPEQDRTEDFLRLWTAKEALGKALGVGLRGSGTRRRVPLEPALRRAWTPFPGRAFALALPECPPGVVVAVAAAQPAGAPPVRLYGSGLAGCRPWRRPDGS